MYIGYIKVYLDGRENKYKLNSKELDTLRQIKVQVIENSTFNDLSKYTKAEIRWLKPDGKQVHNDCVISGSNVVVTLTQQMLAASGIAKFEIILLNADGYITTGTTEVLVNGLVHDDSNIDSTDEYQTFQNIVAKFEKIETDLDNSEQYLEECHTIALNENTRISNEELRKTNELTRQSQEATRQAAISNCITATSNANQAVSSIQELIETKVGINDSTTNTTQGWSGSKTKTELDTKVDKAKIANNFVTTEEGYVADARTVKTLKESVDTANNNLGVFTQSSCVTAGSIVVPTTSTNFDIFNWLALSVGTYIIFARANNQEGTVFTVQSVDSNGTSIAEVAVSNNYCNICIPLVIYNATILAFKVKSTTNDYTIWNDPRLYGFSVMKIK